MEVWEAFLKLWVGLAGPPGGPGGVWRTSQRSGRPTWRFKRPSQKSGRVWEVLPEAQKGSVGPPEGSRGPPGGLGGIRRYSQWSGTGREALPEVREGSVVPPRGLGGIGRPSQRYGRDR